ncbi:MAG: hypothetical protein N4A33_01435 [Bacteriovoracaceae bacterium]|nr:hypothetical protein [Bacteriovoracaceae bacterium]
MSKYNSPKNIHTLKQNINTKFKKILEKELSNPMVKATHSWSVASEMIEAMVGKEIFKQWFKEVKPLVFKNNILILQTQNKFAASWINTHYQDLVENILKVQNQKYSCFFIAPK